MPLKQINFSCSYFESCYSERQQVQEDSVDESEENVFFSKDLLLTILDKWMGIFPLWSGLVLGDLSRYDKSNVSEITETEETRSTNSLVENYFGILKLDIPKRKRLRPGEFIRRQYAQAKGKLAEIETLKPTRSARKNTSRVEREEWKPKRDRSKKKSLYFTPPLKFPLPVKKMRKRKLKFVTTASKNLKVRTPRETFDEEEPDQPPIGIPKEKACHSSKSIPLFDNSPSWCDRGIHQDTQMAIVNTCPLDNLLYILYVILKEYKSAQILLNFNEETILTSPLCQIIQHADEGDWFKARMTWIDKVGMNSQIPFLQNEVLTLDIFSTEYDLVVRHWAVIQASEQITRCDGQDCPEKFKRVEAKTVNVR